MKLDIPSLCASFSAAVSDMLVPRTMEAVRQTGRTKLAVAGGGDYAADDEQPVLAGRNSAFLQQGVQGGGVAQLEHGFDAALGFPAADETFIGALAERQRDAAHDDGFACPGFTGDAQETRVGFPGEFVYQGQIPSL